MNRFFIKSTLSAAALAVSLGTIMTAEAEQVNETIVDAKSVRTETVKFSRGELATESGREVVERRIRRAAKNVCGPMSYSSSGNLSLYAERKECYHQAVAQAMSQVDADRLASTSR